MLVSEVKEKYPLVYESILKQIRTNLDLLNPTMTINSCFRWEDTKEGFSFWYCMEHQDIDMAKSICPHLFEEKEDNGFYKVVTNGLFKN